MKRNNGLKIELLEEIYPCEAVLMTCCQFLGQGYIFLQKKGSAIELSLTPKNGSDFKKLRTDFNSELLHNVLRCKIAGQNKEIREHIIKTALFCAQPDQAVNNLLLKDLPGADSNDWQSDPLGIAIPWEEKNKKKKIKK